MSKERDLQEVLDKLGWSYKVPEQPEQEPIAWIIESERLDGTFDKWVSMNKKHYFDSCDRGEPIPLYISTPKREPLSDEEIVKLWANKSPANEFECVRLVEKAHGIGVEQ